MRRGRSGSCAAARWRRNRHPNHVGPACRPHTPREHSTPPGSSATAGASVRHHRGSSLPPPCWPWRCCCCYPSALVCIAAPAATATVAEQRQVRCRTNSSRRRASHRPGCGRALRRDGGRPRLSRVSAHSIPASVAASQTHYYYTHSDTANPSRWLGVSCTHWLLTRRLAVSGGDGSQRDRRWASDDPLAACNDCDEPAQGQRYRTARWDNGMLRQCCDLHCTGPCQRACCSIPRTFLPRCN